ncbi:MAG: hypothetical protein M3O31_00190 [Acidobacteriota bacterium]|nr:hypothetical protein [Acidobacteriota bacterium]
MSAPTEVGIYIFMICLLVPVLTYALVKYLWNQPLRNGPGYFLGVEVPAGFYHGSGKSWVTSYHWTLGALYAVWAVALAAIVISRRWQMTPVWAGGFAMLFVPAMFSFQAWMRHKLGAHPPVRSVALALESRRLGDYISWPMEALAVALVGMSWWLLLRHAGPHFDWRSPLTLSWAALGLIPGKMAMVWLSWPLPAERAEEHLRLQEATRRNWIRVSGIQFQWFFIVILIGGALMHALFPATPPPAWRWILLAVDLAVWGYGMIVMFRGMRQLKAMGRELRPAGSWRTPFGRSSCFGMSSAFQIWCAIWLGGILILIFSSH